MKKKTITIFFTGLPCSGKTTLAKLLLEEMKKKYGKKIILLDGDVFRKKQKTKLSFTKKDRQKNLMELSDLIQKYNKQNISTICAFVSPYEDIRTKIRKDIEKVSVYVEIFVDTPLNICIKRDIKGMYKQAKNGKIKNFTGINDPYEIPKNYDFKIQTAKKTPRENVIEIINFLKNKKI